jgi:hypothetical protein
VESIGFVAGAFSVYGRFLKDMKERHVGLRNETSY